MPLSWRTLSQNILPGILFHPQKHQRSSLLTVRLGCSCELLFNQQCLVYSHEIASYKHLGDQDRLPNSLCPLISPNEEENPCGNRQPSSATKRIALSALYFLTSQIWEWCIFHRSIIQVAGSSNHLADFLWHISLVPQKWELNYHFLFSILQQWGTPSTDLFMTDADNECSIEKHLGIPTH